MTDELILAVKAMQSGILPSFSSVEIKKCLSSCSLEQSISARRKFRKLWRKEMMKAIKEAKNDIEKTKIKIYFSSAWYRRHIVKKKLKTKK